MSPYKELYFAILPLPLVTSSIFGIISGIDYGLENKCNNFQKFSGMVGLTSIGMITGITYPISFPIFAGYMLFKL